MRLATVRTDGRTYAARIDGDDVVLLSAVDVQEVLVATAPRVSELGRVLRRREVDLAPPVTRPAKILCVGLNYRSHILEIGIPQPQYPTLFAKFASTLIGPNDDLVLPEVADEAMWEVELTIVMGQKLPRGKISVDQALEAIGGYTVANDFSMRDWQRRTKEWLQGKAFDATTPVGPVMVTPDEVDHAQDLQLRCEVDGQVLQSGSTADLLFAPGELVAYIAQFASLEPGDLILTGTPAGTGPGVTEFLRPGQVVRSWIDGIGECRNLTVAEVAATSPSLK